LGGTKADLFEQLPLVPANLLYGRPPSIESLNNLGHSEGSDVRSLDGERLSGAWIDKHTWPEWFWKVAVAQFEAVECLGIEVTRRLVDYQSAEKLLIVINTASPVTSTGHSRLGRQNPCFPIVLQQLVERGSKPREPSLSRVLVVVGLFIRRLPGGDIVEGGLAPTVENLSARGSLSLPKRKRLTTPVGDHFDTLKLIG
ncbi:MAG: hypothetical protein M3308_01310, partial [Actinomycetota bacterium]|nr:hypothetical protein [Actinomycetota bacterium]